jgi:CelD/BcsL family acetyltransferase involved in cellulose biosynthesis
VRSDHDAPKAAAAELWQYFLEHERPDFIDLSFIKRNSLLDHATLACPSEHLLEDSGDHIVYARLKDETDWPSFKASLSRRYQGQMGRKARRLAEQGNVTIECVSKNAALYTDWLLAEKRRWAEKTNKRGAWIFSPFFQEFLGRLAETSPYLRTFVLSLNGEPAAVKVIALNPSSCSLIIGSFDPKFEKFSPGCLLDDFWMRYVFENHRDRNGRPLDVDFGAGRETYKLHWSRGNVIPSRTLHLATSVWGSAPHYLRSAADVSKRLLHASVHPIGWRAALTSMGHPHHTEPSPALRR